MLSGCSVRVDDIPLTQLFTMYLGVMGLQVSASGVCSCSDISSASWKTTSADSHERVCIYISIEQCFPRWRGKGGGEA